MPLYEYLCSDCQERFSLLQKMGTNETETRCPKCGGSQVTRQISGCAIGGSSGGDAAPSCSIGGG